MTFVSFQFLAFAVVSIFALRLPLRGIARDAVIFALNAIFVASYYSSLAKALPFLSFLALGYAAILLARYWNTTTVLSLLITSIVVIFAWLKQYAFLAYLHPLRTFPFHVIGLSYVLFRILHLVVDVAQGAAVLPSPLRYINYCLFFPNFVSGPIQRYQDFAQQLEAPSAPLTAATQNVAMGRIVKGLLMVFVISSVATTMLAPLENSYYELFAFTDAHLAARAIIVFTKIAVIYLINIYANFAGYMHIVIGVAQLAGFRIPENFNEPYKAKNFMDLWARWHITLSEWFKFYLFNPLFKALSARMGTAENTPYLGALCFFVTFLVMGIWHGSTLIFVVYGLFLGCGATVNKLWQVALTKTFCKTCYKNLVGKEWYFQISRAMTLSYFAIGLTCLWLPPEKSYMLLSARGAVIATAAFFLLTVVGTGVGVILHNASKKTAPLYLRLTTTFPEILAITRMAVELVIIVLILTKFSGTTPEFIYKMF